MTEFEGPSQTAVLSTRASDRIRRTDATWIATDLGRPSTTAEIERRVSAAVDDLAAPVDFVVTHDPVGLVPRASAAIRTLGTGTGAHALAKEIHARLGGSAVVLAPSAQERVAIVLGDAAFAWDCLQTATMSRDGLAGRCVRFPGQARLKGLVSVRRLLERSAVTTVTGRGLPVSPDDLVDVRGPLRPVFDDGQLVLAVAAGPHGTLVPDTWCATSASPLA